MKKLCTLHVKQFGLESKFAVILAIGKSIEGVHGKLRLQVTESKIQASVIGRNHLGIFPR